VALVSFQQSLKILSDQMLFARRGEESIPVRSALGRVLARSVRAVRPNPENSLAAMDGIAVDARVVGQTPCKLLSSQWVRINTGEPIPSRFNAVVRIEFVRWENDLAVITHPVAVLQDVRISGEDFSEGDLLFAANSRLQPQDLALLLAAGLTEVVVYRKPVVSFLPTGNEFVRGDGKTAATETNSSMIGALVEMWGGVFHLAAPVPDDANTLKTKIATLASSSDLVVISGGTSLGTGDHTGKVLESLGTLRFHGVAMSPAKPVLFADIQGTPVLGLPGYAVSTYVAAHIYLRRILSALTGLPLSTKQEVHICAEDLPVKEVDQIVRVNLYDVEGFIYASRIPAGASSLTSLSQMDGLLHVPAKTAVRKRDAVRVDVISERSRTAVVIRGCGDPLISALFDQYREEWPDARILFWEAEAEEALQFIIERNSHIGMLATPSLGPDWYADFAGKLQETMLRYRVLSRTIALMVNANQATDIQSLRSGARIVVPKQQQQVWARFCKKHQLENAKVTMMNREKMIPEFLRSQYWDAAFMDLRFAKSNLQMLATVKEHVDLVVSESYASMPAIAELIRLAESDRFGKLVQAQRGCEIRSRGLVDEVSRLS
jgi:molybdenum cofactor synthesis domain-containing protein